MDNVLKIALCGTLRSGKDTVAVRLWEHHDFHHPLAFGDALKRIAHATYPHIEKTPKPRALYQFMNVMRDFDSDVWIRHIEIAVRYALNSRSTTGIVITDVRQANELAWCKANGFTVIRVNAPIEIRIARAKADGDEFSTEDLSHSTEQYSEGFAVDFEINNDGSYDNLTTQIDAIIAAIKAGDSE